MAMKAGAVRDKIAHALVAAQGHPIATLDEANAFIDAELDFAGSGTYGGATACVEIESGDSFFVCDMGSGLREFGLDAVRRCGDGRRRKFNIFQSHLHWDHIMGFPFFVPAFDPGARIVIHSAHPDAEEALRRQQEEISFPVPFDWLRASIDFVEMTPGQPIAVDGLTVVAEKQQHSHDSYGYRFTSSGGQSVVFSTDSEHKADNMKDEAAFIEFFRGADLVICDTMYSLADSVSMKEDWGHSSNVVAVDLCHHAGAKRLALFHHEPTYDDEDIQRMHRESIRYEELTREGDPLEVLCAYDGLEIRL